MKPILVTSLDHLKELIAQGHHDFFLSLAGGQLRSSKEISYNKKTKRFSVFSSIDGEYMKMTEQELMDPDYMNIKPGIDNEAFFCEVE